MTDSRLIPDTLEGSQALIVTPLRDSLAEAVYYVLTKDGWTEDGRCEAFIGKNGVGKEKEGDGKTPVGTLGIKSAFGFGHYVGALPYTRITDKTVACDTPGPFYNTITEEDVEGERMTDYPQEYEFGLETDFNSECIYPKGSAIFIHCKGPKSWTGGCIALDRNLMRHILMTCDLSMIIVVCKGPGR